MTNREKLEYLTKYLLKERKMPEELPDNEQELFLLYRSLVNTRLPAPIDDEYLRTEEEYLRSAAVNKGITDVSSLQPREPHIFLWHGDITTLRCGAIVNAANSGMTGCYSPCHSCIDNCIHTFAGVRLRNKCDEIMREQGHEEPTGSSKITPAYDLPCKYVIHTVGPIVHGALDDEHCRLLRSCYESCLDTAVKNDVGSIAFCCISTGVFGFPQDKAAEIAVDTVRKFVRTHDLDVVFNVFTETDFMIYDRLLS